MCTFQILFISHIQFSGSEKKYPFLKVTGTASALSKAKNELRNGVDLMGRGPVNVSLIYFSASCR